MQSRCGAPVIGVNARDLATFEIDRSTQLDLVARRIPADRIAIAESGIHTRAQGAAAELAGADAVLVGSALMQAPDPGEKLRELLARPLVKVCGLTREEDVAVAAEAGADLAGFILAPESPRAATERCSPFPSRCSRSPSGSARPRRARRPSTRCTSALPARSAAGTPSSSAAGRRSRRWSTCPGARRIPATGTVPRQAEGRVVLAGGLDSSNVAAAIRAVRPWAVDASSRLEAEPGIKDQPR